MNIETENDLKSLLLVRLSCDFILEPEVRGVNLVDQKQVVIDFLVKPKSHIIDNGFIDKWFGIEVKYIPNNGEEKKIKQALWQSVTYAQSSYNGIRPPFVFLFTNDIGAYAIDAFHRQAILSVKSFCQFANVGSLEVNENGYRFSFGNQGYYRIGEDGMHYKGKTNAGLIRYTGNFLGAKSKNRVANVQV